MAIANMIMAVAAIVIKRVEDLKLTSWIMLEGYLMVF
jgi:hypothetical protein